MLLDVIVLGIVEGLTEFIPVSSTGHLILVSHWLGLQDEEIKTFNIVIQLGAILAVVWEYRRPLSTHALGLFGSPGSRRYYANIVIAFLPSAVAGFFLHDLIKERLFNPRTVAYALAAGAVCLYVVERLAPRSRIDAVDRIGARQALGVGLAQCAALFPGFSRSAATILGGLLAGLDRRTATEFSFLLAIPTILGASVLDLAKSFDVLNTGELAWIGLGFLVSFVTAWATLRWFLRFVSRHSLRAFALYRLALALVVFWALGVRMG